MSGHDEPAFDDPKFDDVRELLADARVTDPVPDDVAARLDATLESLHAERAADGRAQSRPVVPLRHRAGRILVAAAAVVVIGAGGVGIAQLDLGGSGDGGTADTAAVADEDSSAPESADGLEVSPEVPGALVGKGVARLSHATFAQDAARLMVVLDQRAARGASKDDATTDSNEELADGEASGYVGQAPPVTASPPGRTSGLQTIQDCAGPDAADAILVPATLDGATVALVFRPPTDDAQQVEAWSCDGSTLLASASVPRS